MAGLWLHLRRPGLLLYGLPRFIASTRPKAMTFKALFHINYVRLWPLEVSVTAVRDDNGRSTIAAQCVFHTRPLSVIQMGIKQSKFLYYMVGTMLGRSLGAVLLFFSFRFNSNDAIYSLLTTPVLCSISWRTVVREILHRVFDPKSCCIFLCPRALGAYATTKDNGGVHGTVI
jgi:hypothetical protein